MRTTWNFDKGLVSAEELRSVQRAASERLIGLQAAAGCADATDGQFGWQDLLRPIAESTAGIEVAGLRRFHETNTFVRRPKFVRAFSASDLDAQKFLGFTRMDLLKGAPRPKIVLPAPYFFVRWAVNEAFPDDEAAGAAIAGVLNGAARAAQEAGVKVVQFNDPVLVHESAPDVPQALRWLAAATAGLDAETIFYPYAGDAAPHWKALSAAPCDRLGVDFLETDLDRLGPTQKKLLAGVLDSRSSLVEEARTLREFLARAAERLAANDVQPTHVYDLDFVPADVAERKLRALAEACRAPEVVA